MTPNPTNPWDATWTIVRADLDIAHAMLPLTAFRLQNTNTAVTPASYRVVHNQPPTPDCFSGALLRPAGTATPSFSDITGVSQLSLYDQNNTALVKQYADICDSLTAYMVTNTNVQRLEGMARIAPAAASSSRGITPHAVIPTTVQLYLFSNIVAGNLPFLFIRAPLMPQSPLNGDGSAGGYGRY